MENDTGRERQGYKVDGGTKNWNPPPWGRQGPGIRPRAEGGGRTAVGHGSRSRHAAQGADTSGGGWRVAGVDEVHVDNIPHQERRWGAGVHRVR